MKYRTNEFKVSLMWFGGNGICKRSFKKYKDAVTWAEQHLETDLISVRIIGTLSKNEENYNENFNNERKL